MHGLGAGLVAAGGAADLTVGVVAPAADGAVGGDGAGVVAADGDRGVATSRMKKSITVTSDGLGAVLWGPPNQFSRHHQ